MEFDPSNARASDDDAFEEAFNSVVSHLPSLGTTLITLLSDTRFSEEVRRIKVFFDADVVASGTTTLEQLVSSIQKRNGDVTIQPLTVVLCVLAFARGKVVYGAHQQPNGSMPPQAVC